MVDDLPPEERLLIGDIRDDLAKYVGAPAVGDEDPEVWT